MHSLTPEHASLQTFREMWLSWGNIRLRKRLEAPQTRKEHALANLEALGSSGCRHDAALHHDLTCSRTKVSFGIGVK